TATILTGPGGAAVLAAYFGVTQAAAAAAIGAIAAAGASMALTRGMKGSAYGGEEFAADFAVQTANAVVAVATAGMGQAAVRAVSRAPAFAALARAAEGGVLARMSVNGLAGGVDGLIQGVPGGMMAAILNEDTWKSGNPLGVILEAGGKGALQS